MALIEHVGNALCLDFANTVNARPAPTRDWLRTTEEATSWATSAGVPVQGSAGGVDIRVLGQARDLRETIYRVFSAVARDVDPDRSDLDALAAAYGAAAAHGRLIRTGEGYVLATPGPRTLRVLLREVAASAVDLLTRGQLDRIGECPSCGWLFLDTSKNGRRRWCSMATCGSRDKARRYYATHAGLSLNRH